MNEIQIKILLDFMDDLHKMGITILPKSVLEKYKNEGKQK